MKKSVLMLFTIASACGCQTTSMPAIKADQGTAPHGDRAQIAKTENLSDSIVRTTTQDQLTLTIKVPRETIIGSPVRVAVKFFNQGAKPVLLTYSRPIRALRPVIWWPNMSGKALLTPQGTRDLSNREETSNLTGTVDPGDTWEFEFDVKKYYQLLNVPSSYLLAISFAPERIDSDGRRVPIRFDVGGLQFHLRNPAQTRTNKSVVDWFVPATAANSTPGDGENNWAVLDYSHSKNPTDEDALVPPEWTEVA